MTDIAVIGAGISGLTLALTLQRRGIACTIHTDRGPDDMRAGRLANTVVRYGATIPREHDLGIDHWTEAERGPSVIAFSVTGTPIEFSGPLPHGGSAVDFRLYLPRLLEDFAARGGAVRPGVPTTPDELATLADHHDLTVVASGPGALADLLPFDDTRSGHREPQRLLCAGLWHGIDEADPPAISYAVAPGAGEIFQFPMLSSDGRVGAVLLEAVRGGPLAPLADRALAEDHRELARRVLDAVVEHAPKLAARVTPERFEPTGRRDVFQGAVTPAVRRSWVEIWPGRFVVAIGDGWVANDPISGQGANLGSACAAALADLIAGHTGRFDGPFCRHVDEVLWRLAEPVCRFTDALLEPPAQHVLDVLTAATADASVAAAFTTAFADPPSMWAALSSPAGAAAFIARARRPGDAPARNAPNGGSSRHRHGETVET